MLAFTHLQSLTVTAFCGTSRRVAGRCGWQNKEAGVLQAGRGSILKFLKSEGASIFLALAPLLFFSQMVNADTQEHSDPAAAKPSVSSANPVDSVPDIRNAKTILKLQKGSFVAVPIPVSSPTFGSGLIAGGAYFYSQTPEQKASQPASLTAVAAGYTSSDSYFAGIGQQNYWDKDNWRFSGLAGYVHLKLELRDPLSGNSGGINWDVDGVVTQATLSKQVFGGWYVGVLARYLDISQEFSSPVSTVDFDVNGELRSAGAGITLDYDSRDVPTNAYSGSYFQSKAIFSSVSGGQNSPYQSYYLSYRNYYQISERLVLASEVSGCTKSGSVPLWDTCRIDLRGFAITDYLGKSSLAAQAAGRWHLTPRWGFVMFAGGGMVTNSFSDNQKNQLVPSYGAGVRFMVLKSKRINLRVDYGRSTDSDAWYVSVGEAF